MNKSEALAMAVKMHQTFKSTETDGISLEFELNENRWRLNSDDDIEHIEDGEELSAFIDGNCYSLEIRWIVHEDDDYLYAMVDNGCGDKYYVVFLKSNIVKL